MDLREAVSECIDTGRSDPCCLSRSRSQDSHLPAATKQIFGHSETGAESSGVVPAHPAIILSGLGL